jgi:tRNA pseudouridine55 synthase
MPERTVTVTRFEERWRDPPRVGLSVACSTGTYVRSLVADLGDAYCEELRRTSIGPFAVDDADPERVVALGDALVQVLPTLRLGGADAKRAGHGVAVEAAGPPGAEHVLLVDDDGPIAVAEPREGGLLKPTVGFRA